MSIQVNKDNTRQVVAELKNALEKSLEESGLLVETAAKKLCPKVTGNLSNSITHQKSGDLAVQIGTTVKYGKYVELKPSNKSGHPFLRPSLENSQNKIRDIFKRNLS